MRTNNHKTKIIDYLSSSKEPANADHLSKVLSIKSATVRSILTRLEKEGVLRREGKLRGFYKINPVWQDSMHGVSSEYQYNPINWQNIVATVDLHKEVTFFEEERKYPIDSEKPIWKVKITLGATNSKLTINLSGAPGYDPRSVMLIIDSIIREFDSIYKLDITTKDVIFKTQEWFTDKVDVRVSENLMSFDIMNRNMRKIYNKPYGVRTECKNSAEIPFDMLLKSFTDPSVLNYLSDIKEMKKDIIDIKNNQCIFYKYVNNNYKKLKESIELLSVKNKYDVDFKSANIKH